MDMDAVFRELGLTVLERGWLSSNNIVIRARAGAPASVIDSGYDSQRDTTVRLIGHLLDNSEVERVINTHLHSDHCGGNVALQQRWGCEAWVPEVSLDVVRGWDEDRLTFRATGQRCERFIAQRGLAVGESLLLGRHEWRAVPAPGHDPDALMFHQPDSGVLLTADALWENRLAIIFPELEVDEPGSGFADARAALDAIEALAPRIVIPGHGRPFTNVAAALESSRQRIDRFEAEPERHLDYAARALTMFHMLEHRSMPRPALEAWLTGAPALANVHRRLGRGRLEPRETAHHIVDRLVEDRLLTVDGAGEISVA